MRREHCILLDDDDNVVGSDSKRNCHTVGHDAFENQPHRAFSVFLFNKHGKLLLQRRSEKKITFPMVWTNTCCSHPLHVEEELEGGIGESFAIGARRAATRKLKDELGIEAEDAPPEDFTFLTRIHYKAESGGGWGEHEIDYIFFMRTGVDGSIAPKPEQGGGAATSESDISVVPNPEEVADVRYVDRDELRQLLADADREGSDVVLSPWFRLLVRALT